MIYYFDKTQAFASIFIYFIVIMIAKKSQHNEELPFFIFLSLMYAYIVCVVYYTIFPIYADSTMKDIMGEFSFHNNFNIVPFRGILNQTSLLNIAMTIPFGFLLPFIVRVRFPKVVAIGTAFSLCIESIQLILGLYFDFSVRIIDVNDVICNTLGAVLGYLIFEAFIIMLAKAINGDCSSKFILYMIERR